MTQPSEKVGIGFDVDSATLAALVRQFGDLERQTLSYTQKSDAGFSGLIKSVSAFGFQLFGLRQALQPLAQLKQGFESLFSTNIQFENFAAEFKVLLGSTEDAQKRINELAEFARKTPFELPQVVQASKILQTFGGDALATGEGLKMVGDVASGTGVGINELAIYFGRLYDALQSGRPAGEAMQRLQELGAITGETRGQIEAMTKAGADGNEVWAFATQSFERYAGMMEEKSKTVTGGLSNISDGINLMKRDFLQAVFEEIRPAIMALAEALGDPALQEKAASLGAKLGEAVAGIGEVITSVGEGIDWSALYQGIESVATALEALVRVVGPPILAAFKGFGEALAFLINLFTSLPESTQQFVLLGAALAIVGPYFSSMAFILPTLFAGFMRLATGVTLLGGAFTKTNLVIAIATAALIGLDLVLEKYTGKGILDRIMGIDEEGDAKAAAIAKEAHDTWLRAIENEFGAGGQPTAQFVSESMNSMMDAAHADWRMGEEARFRDEMDQRGIHGEERIRMETANRQRLQDAVAAIEARGMAAPVGILTPEAEAQARETMATMIEIMSPEQLVLAYNQLPYQYKAILDDLTNMQQMRYEAATHLADSEMDIVDAMAEVWADPGALGNMAEWVQASGDFGRDMALVLSNLDAEGRAFVMSFTGTFGEGIKSWDEFVSKIHELGGPVEEAFNQMSEAAMTNLERIKSNFDQFLPDIDSSFDALSDTGRQAFDDWYEGVFKLRDAFEGFVGNLQTIRGHLEAAFGGVSSDMIDAMMLTIQDRGPEFAAALVDFISVDPTKFEEAMRAGGPAAVEALVDEMISKAVNGKGEMQIAWEGFFKDSLLTVLQSIPGITQTEIDQIMGGVAAQVNSGSPEIQAAWNSVFRDTVLQVLKDSKLLTDAEIQTIMDSLTTIVTGEAPDMQTAGETAAGGAVTGVENKAGDMNTAGGLLADNLIGGFEGTLIQKKAVLLALMDGFVGELRAKAQTAYNEITNMQNQVGNYGESTSGQPGGLAVGSTNFPGGMTWVGEMGKELVALPSGSRIFSNREVREQGLGSGGGVTVQMNNVTINASSDAQARASVNGLGYGLFYNLKGRGLI